MQKYQQALVIRQALYGSVLHHHVAYSLNSVGKALITPGQQQKGLEHLELELAEKRHAKKAHLGHDYPVHDSYSRKYKC
jgi:hypothetical protein